MAPSTNSLLLSLSERFALIGNHFIDALDNEFVLIGLTFAIFFLAKMVQRRTGWVLFNPILITIGAMIAFLKLTGIQYDTYHKAGSQIEFWLKPAIVALGVPLYQQLKVIRKQLIPILLSQTVGCVVGIVSAVVTAQLLGASKPVVISLAPKSVTTPIAMEVCRTLGGIPSLTAAIVVIVGLLGAVTGFRVLQIGRVKSPIAQGLSMGAASHAVGTSRAMENGAKYGAFASLGLIANGVLHSNSHAHRPPHHGLRSKKHLPTFQPKPSGRCLLREEDQIPRI